MRLSGDENEIEIEIEIENEIENKMKWRNGHGITQQVTTKMKNSS